MTRDGHYYHYAGVPFCVESDTEGIPSDLQIFAKVLHHEPTGRWFIMLDGMNDFTEIGTGCLLELDIGRDELGELLGVVGVKESTPFVDFDSLKNHGTDAEIANN